MEQELSHLPAAAGPPDEQRFFRRLQRVLARVPFAEDLLAAYYCALDPRTPARARGILFGAIAYFLMPADLVPDFVVVLGFTDDAAVIAAVLANLARHVRPDHRTAARERLEALRQG